MKMVRQEAFPLSGDAGISDIRDMIANDRIPAPAARPGRVTTGDILADTSSTCMSFIDPGGDQAVQRRPRRRAAAWRGLVAPRLFDRLPCRTTRLCFTSTARFPNHEANPLIEENRRDIVERVVAEKADVGIAWDGDADRCFFIDGTRRVHLRRLRHGAARRGVSAHATRATTIIYDLRASYAVKDIVAAARRHGADEPRRPRVHQARMREVERDLRRRGHRPLLLPRNFYADNGFIPGAADAGADVEEGPEPAASCSSRCASATSSPARSTPRSASMDAVPTRSWRTIAATIRATANSTQLDGFSVEYPDWHFNVAAVEHGAAAAAEPRSDRRQAMMERRRDEVLALIRA